VRVETIVHSHSVGVLYFFVVVDGTRLVLIFACNFFVQPHYQLMIVIDIYDIGSFSSTMSFSLFLILMIISVCLFFIYIFFQMKENSKMMKGKNNRDDFNQQPKDMMRWSEEMDLALLNALTEEAHKGNRHDGSWTTEAYNNVVELLRTTIGGHITKQHIKNRMKTMKENFGEAYDLFNSLSGFAWNSITRKFEAEEEVWDALIKVYTIRVQFELYLLSNVT
jgi:hypothetical protein